MSTPRPIETAPDTWPIDFDKPIFPTVFDASTFEPRQRDWPDYPRAASFKRATEIWKEEVERHENSVPDVHERLAFTAPDGRRFECPSDMTRAQFKAHVQRAEYDQLDWVNRPDPELDAMIRRIVREELAAKAKR